MKKFLAAILLLVAIAARYAAAFSTFRSSFPNGAKVANPCNPSVLWPGVGHWNIDGGGDRNPFGRQFQANDYQWTVELCKADSDGDGRTNGQELGDPNCLWSPGKQPSRTINITHPGLCEPINSALCKQRNTYLKCNPTESCPLLQEPGVLNLTLKFPHSKVPAVDTSYYCRVFKLPTDRLYDMIATKPVVDNKMVVHHMQLYGCEKDINLPHTDGQIFPCTMGLPGFCTSIMALWSLGADGDCLTEEYGYRIGYNAATQTTGYKYAALEIHWTNYDLHTNQYDSSGLNIFYTPRLRPNKAAILQLGQYDLNIPPRTKETALQAVCSSTCSQKTLKTPVKISQATVHAHLLAKKGSIELHRNGNFLRFILKEYLLDFNAPKMFLLEPPIDYLPGDVIKVNCIYDSSDRAEATHYGDGTRDEMCIGYLVYYPAQEPVAFTNCGQWKDVALCNDEEEATCDADLLTSHSRPIFANCAGSCTLPCQTAIQAMLDSVCGSDAMMTELAKNPENFALLDEIDRCLVPTTKVGSKKARKKKKINSNRNKSKSFLKSFSNYVSVDREDKIESVENLKRKSHGGKKYIKRKHEKDVDEFMI